MKTTIELSDELLRQTRKVARQEGATLRALVEEGLRLALRARQKRPAASFRLKTFRGDGLTGEFRRAGWEKFRDEIYRDRS